MKKSLKNLTRTWMKLVAVVWMVIGLVACGDSEAFYSVLDDNDQASQGPTGGKGDVPNRPSTRAPARDISLASRGLEFEGEGFDALIVIDNGDEVVRTFSSGAVICTHSMLMGGVVMTWEGDPGEVFVRRRSGFMVGDWEPLMIELSEGNTFRGRRLLDEKSSQVDIYVANPDVIQFMIIEPLEPMR
jgi:hypothetical protein